LNDFSMGCQSVTLALLHSVEKTLQPLCQKTKFNFKEAWVWLHFKLKMVPKNSVAKPFLCPGGRVATVVQNAAINNRTFSALNASASVAPAGTSIP
jgi:hypothetical protein